MTKREKILLGMLMIAVIGAGIDQLMSRMGAEPKEQAPAVTLADARNVVMEISARQSNLPLQAGQLYALEASRRAIAKNPFLPEKVVIRDLEKNAPQTSGAGTLLSYTGFVQVGRSLLAIISGMEYAVGDVIPSSGDEVREITAAQVTLFSPSRKAEWTLSYSGDEF